MKRRDLVEFIVLAGLWGASFLFMRMAVPEFGPFALMALRCGLAALLMVGWLAWRGQFGALRASLWRTGLIGVAGSAIPFVLIGWALKSMPAGLGSIFNATTSMWTALVGWLWFAERLPPRRLAGIVIGFVGVVILASGGPGQPVSGVAADTAAIDIATIDAAAIGRVSDDAASTMAGAALADNWLPVLACLLATLSYAIAANATRRYLQNVPPMLGAAGSQIGATLALAPFALASLPVTPPSIMGWTSAVILAVACTALAYLLFYRLLRNIGPQRAASVTYVIPLFGVLWGAAFLGERLEPMHVIGGSIIVAGSALVLGLKLRRPWPAAANRPDRG